MNKLEIKPGVYYVGVVDWNLRDFHGYAIKRGTTYNAYLIIDEKIALIDTVKESFSQELIDRISEIIDPSKIDYLISNHVEMDHSGSIPAIMKVATNATIVTSSPSGLKGLKAHYGDSYPYHEVKAGEAFSLGKRSITFITTPMLHWPDNMVTYCPEEKILFSNDALGQHYTSNRHFDDEVNIAQVMYEARDYYANILMPFGAQTNKVLSLIEGMDIDLIAPSHGVIWRGYVKEILAEYHKFADETPEDTALIVYDTMWHSTEKMALSILEGFTKRGTNAVLMDLKVNSLAEIMTEALNAQYIIVGSPTVNNGMLPNVAAFLSDLKGLAPKLKKGFAFGSYGWSGQSIGLVNQALTDMGFEIILDPIRINYLPSKQQLIELEQTIAALPY